MDSFCLCRDCGRNVLPVTWESTGGLCASCAFPARKPEPKDDLDDPITAALRGATVDWADDNEETNQRRPKH